MVTYEKIKEREFRERKKYSIGWIITRSEVIYTGIWFGYVTILEQKYKFRFKIFDEWNYLWVWDKWEYGWEIKNVEK